MPTFHFRSEGEETEVENINSGLGEAETDRQGRFAMYWMTTTFTSTTTSYTATTTIGGHYCRFRYYKRERPRE